MRGEPFIQQYKLRLSNGRKLDPNIDAAWQSRVVGNEGDLY